MLSRILLISLLATSFPLSFVSAADVATDPFNNHAPAIAACQQQLDQTRQDVAMSAPASWQRVHIKDGAFSLILPYSSQWTAGGKAVLPYTPIDATSNGSFTPPKGIHFGRYRLDDITCDETSGPLVLNSKSAMREYVVDWAPEKAKRKTASSPNDLRIPIKIGAYQGSILRVDGGEMMAALMGKSCQVTETLELSVKHTLIHISSPCRPIGVDHFRIASSILSDKK